MGNVKDFEQCLSVGQTFIYCPESGRIGQRRYRAVLRGWYSGYYLSLDRPKANDRFVALRDSEACIMRFLYEGQACGFDSMVLGWDGEKAMPQFRVAWPREFQMVSIRKHERVKVHVPGTLTVKGGNTYPVEILDISEGGCGICTTMPTGLEAQDDVRIAFTLPDGSLIDGIIGTICTSRPTKQGMIAGCQFRQDQESLISDIRFFILAVLGRMMNKPGHARRVVVIEQLPDNPQSLSNTLEREGYEVVPATGVMEAFYRLRMAQPTAMILHYEQQELPWDQICRVVRGTRGFEELPIFLFAPPDPSVQSRVIEAGVTAYFDNPEFMARAIPTYV